MHIGKQRRWNKQAPGEQGRREEQATRRTGKEERTINQKNREGGKTNTE